MAISSQGGVHSLVSSGKPVIMIGRTEKQLLQKAVSPKTYFWGEVDSRPIRVLQKSAPSSWFLWALPNGLLIIAVPE